MAIGEIGEIPGTGGGGLGPGAPEEITGADSNAVGDGTMNMVGIQAPTYDQVSFRFRNDDGFLGPPP